MARNVIVRLQPTLLICKLHRSMSIINLIMKFNHLIFSSLSDSILGVAYPLDYLNKGYALRAGLLAPLATVCIRYGCYL
jgi:hypothetical protein